MSAGLKGTADVLAYMDKAIDNIDPEQLYAGSWRNDEVILMLNDIRSGILAQDVTWAEVTISELIAERDELREVVAGADHATAKYWRQMAVARTERDRARDLAVRLEAELAVLS
jgi:hypothetical protein